MSARRFRILFSCENHIGVFISKKQSPADSLFISEEGAQIAVECPPATQQTGNVLVKVD